MRRERRRRRSPHRPARGSRGPGYPAARRSSSARSAVSTASSSDWRTPMSRSRATRGRFSTLTTPPSAEAPAPNAVASSPGIPSLRTGSTSHGSRSDAAASAATGTPPHARPSTTVSWRPRNWGRAVGKLRQGFAGIRPDGEFYPSSEWSNACSMSRGGTYRPSRRWGNELGEQWPDPFTARTWRNYAPWRRRPEAVR
jgi:hypothetical protein